MSTWAGVAASVSDDWGADYGRRERFEPDVLFVAVITPINAKLGQACFTAAGAAVPVAGD